MCKAHAKESEAKRDKIVTALQGEQRYAFTGEMNERIVRAERNIAITIFPNLSAGH